MQLEDYFNFLGSETCEPQFSTVIRIKGHRINIEHVLAYYKLGYNPEKIAKEFPGLSLEKIYVTITYYLSHRATVEHYLRRIRGLDEQAYQEWRAAGPSPLMQRLQAWHTVQNIMSD